MLVMGVANNNVNPRRRPRKHVQIPVTPVTDKVQADVRNNNKRVDRPQVNLVEVKEKARNLNG